MQPVLQPVVQPVGLPVVYHFVQLLVNPVTCDTAVQHAVQAPSWSTEEREVAQLEPFALVKLLDAVFSTLDRLAADFSIYKIETVHSSCSRLLV